MMASFLPWVLSVRMWFRRVVLPEPRNPVRTVTGMRESPGEGFLASPAIADMFCLVLD